MAELTVLVADPERMQLLREGLRLDGRVLRFMTNNLPTALESIRTNAPDLVAVDAAFAATPEGRVFLDRVLKLAIPSSGIHVVRQTDGGWSTAPFAAAPAPERSPDPKSTGVNTRRAPRFLVRSTLQAVVESSKASLVDLSVLGAQVVSEPALRPNQTIKIALPDAGGTMRVTAHVAWSLYEKPAHARDPHYRAGLEFTDAARQALDDYCRRHCADQRRRE